MSSVAFGVLGPVEVTVDGATARLRPMERALLAVLLTEPNVLWSPDRLVDSMWLGEPPRTARTAVRVHVDRLRQAMRTSEVSRLATVSGGYRLVLEADELDADLFEDEIRRGRGCRETDPWEAARLLRTALSRWRGTPFAGLDLVAVAHARTRLESRHAELLDLLAETALACGAAPELLPELAVWTRQSPWSESLTRSHAIALYRSGRQVEALEVCRSFREQLSEDLGLDPSEGLERLERQILNHEVAPTPPRPPEGATPESMSVRAPGRQRELEQLLDLTRGRFDGVIAVVGRRGLGASTVIAALRDSLPGSLFVRCDAHRAIGVVEELETALGLGVQASGQDERTVEARAQRLLGSLVARPATALLIDEVQQLGADDAAVLARVAAAKPRSLAMVTAGPDLTDRGHPLLGGDGLLRVTVLELRHLDPVAARELACHLLPGVLAARTDVVDRLVEIGGGDALVLESVARHVAAGGDLDELPGALTEIVRRGRRELRADSDDVASTAAVLGEEPWDLDVIAAALGIRSDDVVAAAEEALAVGLVREDAGGVRFRHRLVGEAFVEGLGGHRRRELHARLGTHLASVVDADPARVARHLRDAGSSSIGAEAARWTAREAGQLTVAGAWIAAGERYAEAVELGTAHGVAGSDLLTWRLEHGTALRHAGAIERSMDAAAEVARDARRAGDHEAFERAAVAATGPLLPTGEQRTQAADLTEEAWERHAGGSPARTAALLDAWVRAHCLDPDPAVLEEWAPIVRDRLDDLLTASHPSEVRALAHRAAYDLGFWFREGPAERSRHSTGLASEAGRAGQPVLQLEGLRLRSLNALELGDLRTAARHLDRYRRRARDAGSPMHQWWSATMDACCAELRGDSSGAARARADAESHVAFVDPDLLVVASLERAFCSALRSGDFTSLLETMQGDLGPDLVEEDPVLELGGQVVLHRLGEAVDDGLVGACWQSVRRGPYAVAGAFLVAQLCRPDSCDPVASDEVLTEAEQVLSDRAGTLAFLNGADCLGPVDAALAGLRARDR